MYKLKLLVLEVISQVSYSSNVIIFNDYNLLAAYFQVDWIYHLLAKAGLSAHEAIQFLV